jgi:hypothetical protein
LTVIHGREGFERLLHIPPSDDSYVISFQCVSCEEEFLLLIAKGAFEMRLNAINAGRMPPAAYRFWFEQTGWERQVAIPSITKIYRGMERN